MEEAKKKIIELQKQVDELKKRNYWLESEHEYQCEKSYFEGVEKGREQTVKNKINEFAKRLKNLVAERNCNENYDWEDVQIDGQIFLECVDEIAKEIIKD